MDFPLKNIWMTNWAINYFLQKTDWVCDKFRFFNKFEWVSYDIPLSKSIDWPCNGFPFWKQLTDCAMDFFFETTDCLCDGIPFWNNWLTVQWNSFCEQPTSDGIPFWNKWLTVRWNSFVNSRLPVSSTFFFKADCAMEFPNQNYGQTEQCNSQIKTTEWWNYFCNQPTYCLMELLF